MQGLDNGRRGKKESESVREDEGLRRAFAYGINRALMIPAELLLHAYRQAVFPMAMEDGEIAWFSPDPRAIIPLDAFHVPHGLKRTLKKGQF